MASLKHRLAGLDFPVPTAKTPKKSEHSEQARFCLWLDTWLPAAGGRYHAIVNEGRRSPGERTKAHQQGLRAGVPDIYVFHPAAGLIACEFKRADGTRSDVKPAQREWLAFLGEQMGERFFARAVFGCDEAMAFVRAVVGT